VFYSSREEGEKHRDKYHLTRKIGDD